MNDVIEKHAKELEEVFRKEGVVLAYLFGSQARGAAGPQSDIDIAVLSIANKAMRGHIFRKTFGKAQLPTYAPPQVLGMPVDKQVDMSIVYENPQKAPDVFRECARAFSDFLEKTEEPK